MAEPLSGTFAAHAPGRLTTSSHALLVADDDGTCVEASLGACRLLARARAEVVGEPVGALLEPASRERFAHFWRAFRTGGGLAEPFGLEAPAAVPPVAIRVTAEVVPGRHLLRLEPIASPVAQRIAESEAEAAGEPVADESRPGVRQPSARERQVLALLAGGATDGQIADQLELSPATVQTHVRNAKAKLGARTRAQAVALAIQRGLIALG